MHWGLTVGPPWLLGCDRKEREREKGGEQEPSSTDASLKVGIPEAAAV